MTTATLIASILIDTLKVDPEKAGNLDARLVADMGLDSLDAVELAMELEDRLDLPDSAVERVISDNFGEWSLRDLVQAVEEVVKEKVS